MDKFLYLAMTGAKAASQAQRVNNHNLANANTPGFKADFDRFMSEPVKGPGYDARIYSQETDTGYNFDAGAMISTGNNLDFAVQGEGFIGVQTVTGEEAYTRRGDLQISPDGILMNGAGQKVMGNGGPIALPAFDRMEIGEDGTVSIIPQGGEANSLLVVDRIKLVTPDFSQFTKGEDGLFRQKNGEPLEADGAVRVASGVLESSNVNIVDSMVDMISLARQYEANIKMMTTASEIDESSSRLLRLT